MRTLKFELLLTRPSGGHRNPYGPDPFCLRVTDELSGQLLIELEFRADQLADLLSTRAIHGVLGKWRGADKIGTRKETLDIELEVKEAHKDFKQAVKSWNKLHQEEGWTIQKEEFNHHYYDYRSKKYRTHAVRWVEVDDE
jgi:hypothetical protein